jgi:hypothetical protein
MPRFSFPRRTIHLDFHTGPDIPDVGSDFDPEQFARTFKDAHVDSVTVFAVCHHGHSYYDTDHSSRHPGLRKGFDLTGAQVKALHGAGIKAPIYISCQVNEFAARNHPDWVAINPDGSLAKRFPRDWEHTGRPTLEAGWYVMDMSGPYQDYIAEQIQEVLDRYHPVDGIFLDMCWDQPSVSKWAIEGMLAQKMDPRDETDRVRYAREVAHGYMGRFSAMVESSCKGADHMGIWFNSRPKTNLHVEKKFLRHVEIEALPTGGWGYAYFPYVARFVRPLALPTLSHTGRFFRSWGDNASLKPEAALRYECCQILSQGMTGGVGDLLHPSGKLQEPVYDLIGRVYSHIESCEALVEGAKLLSEIALLVNADLGDSPGPAGLGATRALQQLKQQFDVVPPLARLDSYRVVIVPETTRVDEELAGKLEAYVEAGGGLVFVGPAAIDDEGRPVLAAQGISTHGASPFTRTFLRAGRAVGAGIPDYDHVMYEPGFRMKPLKGAQSLVRVVEPYFERSYRHHSGHSYTPPAKLSSFSAVVRNESVITFSVPILEAYGKHAPPVYRRLLGNCLNLLLPEPLVRCEGPSGLETTVMRKGKTTIVHLLSFCPERRAEGLDIVEEPFPLVKVPISVRLENAPKVGRLEPQGVELGFTYENGRATTDVTLCDGHGMLVFY